MKILLINKFHYLRGGAEKVYFETARILREHGHEVRFFSMKHPQNIIDPDSDFFVDNSDYDCNSNFLQKTKNIFWNEQSRNSLKELLEDFRPQIAHLHNFTRQISVSILPTLKEHNVRVVQTLHDYGLVCPNAKMYIKGEVCERCFIHNYWQSVKNKCLKDSYLKSFVGALEMNFYQIFKNYRENIDLFISPSQFLKQKMVDWQVKQPIAVLPNFVSTAESKKENILEDFVLFAGRLTTEKGINFLLRAVKSLPEINFVFAGDGELRSLVQQAQKKFKNLRYLGNLSATELQDYLQRCRLLVVPSLWYENMPMAILEAQVLQKTVLASKIGGMEELIENNSTGLFFRAGDLDDLIDKILTNFHDLAKLRRMGELAQEKVIQEFNEEKYYQKLIEIYREVLGKDTELSFG